MWTEEARKQHAPRKERFPACHTDHRLPPSSIIAALARQQGRFTHPLLGCSHCQTHLANASRVAINI
jgi:hypothetical protein